MSIQDLEVINDYNIKCGNFQMLTGGFPNYLLTSDSNGNATWLPLVLSVNVGITAHPGGGQADAVQLFAGFSQVANVTSPNDSVILPNILVSPSNSPTVVGRTLAVKNSGANNLAVFPPIGQNINNLATDTADIITPGSSITYVYCGSNNWQGY